MFSLDPASTTTPILLKCGYFLSQMRDDTILATLLERMFDELHTDSRYPSELMELLPLYDLQARNLRQLGVVKASVALFKKVFNIRATTLDENHPDRLASQHELAGAYIVNGQITEAAELLGRLQRIQVNLLDQSKKKQNPLSQYPWLSQSI